MTQSGLYDSLEELDELLNQYDKVKLSDPSQAHLLEHFIIEQIQMNQMLDYINLEDYHNHMGYIIEECHKVLTMIKRYYHFMHVLTIITTIVIYLQQQYVPMVLRYSHQIRNGDSSLLSLQRGVYQKKHS